MFVLPVSHAASRSSSSRSSLSDDTVQDPGTWQLRTLCSLTDQGAAELLCQLKEESPLHTSEQQKKATTEAKIPPTKVCSDCGRSDTCFWRRDKESGLRLCNACGLYLAKHRHHRPRSLTRK